MQAEASVCGIWGRTGFDGDVETRAAGRGADLYKTANYKSNNHGPGCGRDLVVPVRALSFARTMNHEATEPVSLTAGIRGREF